MSVGGSLPSLGLVLESRFSLPPTFFFSFFPFPSPYLLSFLPLSPSHQSKKGGGSSSVEFMTNDSRKVVFSLRKGYIQSFINGDQAQKIHSLALIKKVGWGKKNGERGRFFFWIIYLFIYFCRGRKHSYLMKLDWVFLWKRMINL